LRVVCSHWPIGFNGLFLTEMYLTRALTVDSISIRTISRWNLHFAGFTNSQVRGRCWGLREIGKNVNSWHMQTKLTSRCTLQWYDVINATTSMATSAGLPGVRLFCAVWAIWLVCRQCSIVQVVFWAFTHVCMAIQQVLTNISRSSVYVKLSTALLFIGYYCILWHYWQKVISIEIHNNGLGLLDEASNVKFKVCLDLGIITGNCHFYIVLMATLGVNISR